MAGINGPEVQTINGPWGLAVLGIGFIMTLNILAQMTLAFLVMTQSDPMYNLPWTVTVGNTILFGKKFNFLADSITKTFITAFGKALKGRR